MPETNYTLTPDYEGWVLMNVTHSAESWTIFPTSNMGLFLKVIDLSSGELRHLFKEFSLKSYLLSFFFKSLAFLEKYILEKCMLENHFKYL